MSSPRQKREIWRLVLMVLMILLSSWAGIKLSLDAGNVSGLWAANGIIAAFVLTAPERWKVALFSAGIFAVLLVDVAWGDPIASAVWIALCDGLEILVIVIPVKHVGARADIANQRALYKIVFLGGFIGPLGCAALLAPAMSLLKGEDLLETFRIWFLSDALGNLASLPALLFLMTRRKGATRPDGEPARLFDNLGWGCLLSAVSIVVFWQTTYPIIFVVFPPLIAMIFQFRLTGAVYGSSLLVIVAMSFTSEARGPFALHSANTPEASIILCQIFGLIVFASCLPVGLLMEERHRLERELRMANNKLHSLALLDPLTGVSNRRAFDQELATEWAAANKTGRETSAIYFDLDYFKNYNDTYGHQKGDDCLRKIAATIVASVRTNDRVARYGGEEFVVLLPGVSSASALDAANRIVAAISARRIPHPGSPFGVVTASIGVATLRPTNDCDALGLIRMADDALYAAKRDGRNRVVVSLLKPTKATPEYAAS